MKKLALGAILGASLMISSSAFALTAMTDANMKSATGQAGVSIAIDNVVIEQYVGSTTYTDTDGTLGTEGSVVISDKHSLKSFNALIDEEDFVESFATAAGIAEDDVLGTWQKASPLTIDVGNCSILEAGLAANLDLVADGSDLEQSVESALADNNIPTLYATYQTLKASPTATATQIEDAYDALSDAKEDALQDILSDDVVDNIGDASIYLKSGLLYAAANAAAYATAGEIDLATVTPSVVGVVIGLPTLLITTSADSYTVGVKMTGAVNDGQDFIKIDKGASTMAILSGKLEIAAH